MVGREKVIIAFKPTLDTSYVIGAFYKNTFNVTSKTTTWTAQLSVLCSTLYANDTSVFKLLGEGDYYCLDLS